jgi:hypothetical protein
LVIDASAIVSWGIHCSWFLCGWCSTKRLHEFGALAVGVCPCGCCKSAKENRPR